MCLRQGSKDAETQTESQLAGVRKDYIGGDASLRNMGKCVLTADDVTFLAPTFPPLVERAHCSCRYWFVASVLAQRCPAILWRYRSVSSTLSPRHVGLACDPDSAGYRKSRGNRGRKWWLISTSDENFDLVDGLISSVDPALRSAFLFERCNCASVRRAEVWQASVIRAKFALPPKINLPLSLPLWQHFAHSYSSGTLWQRRGTFGSREPPSNGHMRTSYRLFA
jgi:hypothetical protein